MTTNDFKTITNMSIAMHWHREGEKPVAMYKAVGIKSLVDEEDGEATVVFTIQPAAIDFLIGMDQGHVEVRFDSLSLDNPFAGKSFMTIKDIKPFRVSVENLAPLELPTKEILFIVKARCGIDWGLFKELNPNYKGDWRHEN